MITFTLRDEIKTRKPTAINIFFGELFCDINFLIYITNPTQHVST